VILCSKYNGALTFENLRRVCLKRTRFFFYTRLYIDRYGGLAVKGALSAAPWAGFTRQLPRPLAILAVDGDGAIETCVSYILYIYMTWVEVYRSA
jgi:hypothetical protein